MAVISTGRVSGENAYVLKHLLLDQGFNSPRSPKPHEDGRRSMASDPEAIMKAKPNEILVVKKTSQGRSLKSAAVHPDAFGPAATAIARNLPAPMKRWWLCCVS